MAIYDGLDLSRFKRVSTDKKSTKLRHARGHEITIAHSALTPKMREQIAKLKDRSKLSRASLTPKERMKSQLARMTVPHKWPRLHRPWTLRLLLKPHLLSQL